MYYLVQIKTYTDGTTSFFNVEAYKSLENAQTVKKIREQEDTKHDSTCKWDVLGPIEPVA